MKAMAPMCRPALSIWAAPGLWVCRVCAITRRKMRSTMLSTAPSRCMKYRNLLGTESTHWRTGGRGIRDRSGCAAVSTMRRVVHGADSPAFAGEGYKVVVPTVAAASAGKAMGKDAALKMLGKRFAHEGGLGVWWSPWPSN
jgi:hypothetical protein